MYLMACEFAHKELDGGLCGPLDGSFEVLGEGAVAAEPGESSFDDPSSVEHLKALCAPGAFDDLKGSLADFGECASEFLASIGAVGEEVAQPGKAVADRRQHIGGAVAVPHIGGMDDGADQKIFGIGEDMARAPLDLLTGGKPGRTAGLRRLHTLAVDHAGGGRRLPAGLLARRHQKRVVDRRPQPHVPPRHTHESQVTGITQFLFRSSSKGKRNHAI